MADRAIGPVTVARNLAFYPLFYAGSVVLVLLAIAVMPVSDRTMRALIHGWSHWHRWCCTHLLGMRVEIDGTPPAAGALVAIRHESFFEAIDLPVLLHLPVVFAKKELMAIPLWGTLGRRYGLIGVDREAGARTLRTMLAAARRTAGQRPLVIFPEGTRVPHDSAPPLQAGFAGIYKMAGLPVVPIAVDSGPLYHRWWKRSGVIRYRIGAPIPPGLPRAQVEAAVHAAINVLHD